MRHERTTEAVGGDRVKPRVLMPWQVAGAEHVREERL